jgi:phage host-nuclease inhibitor protein Gam
MNVEAPESILDPIQARHEAQYRMRKLREHLAAIDRLTADYKDQIGEIEQWFLQESGKHVREVERLKLEMRPYIDVITAADPLKRKSVELVAGRAGFREGRERVVVEDEDAAMQWLMKNRDGMDCVRQTLRVDIPTVKHHFPQPDVIPGIRVERGERTFFCETTGKVTE